VSDARQYVLQASTLHAVIQHFGRADQRQRIVLGALAQPRFLRGLIRALVPGQHGIQRISEGVAQTPRMLRVKAVGGRDGTLLASP
jgi:hypothetical protein